MPKFNKNFNKSNPNLRYVDDKSIEIREKDQTGVTEIRNPTPLQLVNELKKSICTLFFYKATNGAFRRMVCTLKGYEPVPSKFNKPGIVVVWDLDHNNWRSFYPDRVFKLVRNENTKAQ
jgi:hypothetical protein